MSDFSEIYYQTNNIQYIKNSYGKTPWVQISGCTDLNGAEAGFWCALIKRKYVKSVFNNSCWDVSCLDGGPGFVGIGSNYKYKSNLLDNGLEPLLIYRNFAGVRPSYIELSQEFVLLNNLYFDSKTNIYYSLKDDGSSEETVRIGKDEDVFINLSYLVRFAAAKQMAVLLFFDIYTECKGSLKSLGLEEFSNSYKDKFLYYDIVGKDMRLTSDIKSFSRLLGKKIIYPKSVKTCGYWPYENKPDYIDFIIGIDEDGKELTYTCNPDKLSDYFGNNPEAPQYLTPVFFKREVLQKYLSRPDLYTIRDGFLRCNNLWHIEIDNHHKNSISLYLGDIGRDLPEAEWLYWRSFNIISDEGISDISFKRDFLNMFTDSNMIDHLFLEHYNELNTKWNDTYGWPLFLPLTDEDSYNLDTLTIPLNESQSEFDRLVLSLVKVLIDSLNEKKLYVPKDDEKDFKGISKLNKWYIVNGKVNFEPHIKFLRDLQELRSCSVGHRKGSGYYKIAKTFGVGDNSFKDVFENILINADSFLVFMIGFT